ARCSFDESLILSDGFENVGINVVTLIGLVGVTSMFGE
ncbi:unnamed protein product, partial [Rotaria magnacalcarata]